MATDTDIREALRHVLDPEIGVNIVDLGLVYRIEVESACIRIAMTMTSPACPLADYLKDLVTQVAALRKQGLSADEAAQKVDLTSHKADFPQIQGPGADVRGVRRMYEWMDERRARQP